VKEQRKERYDKRQPPAGANYAGVGTYAMDLSYTAWGALKEMAYGNSHPEWGATKERKLYQSYDARLRLTGWDASYVMGLELSLR
jgi:hypothetical protein